MFIATLIAVDRLSGGDISAAADRLDGVSGWVWIDEGRAVDIRFDRSAELAREALEGAFEGVDVVVQPAAGREKRLLVADMDSTMITVECIDELADYAGIKAEVSEITERAMRGELDFEGALDARVKLLGGLDEGVIERCLAERVTIMPGAKALVRTMRARGGHAVLVSGGFTHFADRIGKEIGFDRAISNRLGIAGGVLDGSVARPIVGAEAKRAALWEAMREWDVPVEATLGVGDGANDIPMIEAAGLGVAYHAKPKTAAAADARIAHCDLTALLYAQGIARREWAGAQ